MTALCALGFFIFSPSTGTYEEMERRWNTRRAALDVIGRKPVKHWMGRGDSELILRGSIWPEIQPSGLWTLEALAAVAGTGRPLPVLMGYGRFLGLWGIAEMGVTDRLAQRGGVPGERGFEIVLEGV